jgi:hypothetical protein
MDTKEINHDFALRWKQAAYKDMQYWESVVKSRPGPIRRAIYNAVKEDYARAAKAEHLRRLDRLERRTGILSANI